MDVIRLAPTSWRVLSYSFLYETMAGTARSIRASLHRSVNPNCLELARAHEGTQTQAKNMQPTRYFLPPSSQICVLAFCRSPPGSPVSLSSLIDYEFIPGVAGIRSLRRHAGFDPAALALPKLIKKCKKKNPHTD